MHSVGANTDKEVFMNEEINDQQDLNIYKLLRMANGLTINEVSDKLGVTRAYVSSIENGKRTPSEELKSKYAEMFNVSVNLLETFEFPADKTAPNFVAKSLLRILSIIASKW